jgi:hypothetical protein
VQLTLDRAEVLREMQEGLHRLGVTLGLELAGLLMKGEVERPPYRPAKRFTAALALSIESKITTRSRRIEPSGPRLARTTTGAPFFNASSETRLRRWLMSNTATRCFGTRYVSLPIVTDTSSPEVVISCTVAATGAGLCLAIASRLGAAAA